MTRFIGPYNFVEIDEEKIDNGRSAPIGHDAFPKPDTFSGRIRCSLYGMTPLIAGNEQADGEAAVNGEEGEKHKILKPFQFPNGKYGIADSTLQGMIRNYYAAISHSPIERVNDRTFSFRPNSRFVPWDLLQSRDDSVPQTYMGVLFKQGEEWWLYYITKELREVDFHNNAIVIPETENWLAEATDESCTSREVWQDQAPVHVQDPLILPCGGGLDGNGLLEEEFNRHNPGSNGNCNSKRVRVTAQEWTSGTWVRVDQSLVDHYNATIQHIGNDHAEYHPHVKDSGPIRRAVDEKRKLAPGRVVFLEKLNGQFISMIMSFRGRVVYHDSIAYKNGCFEGKGERRKIFDISDETEKRWEDLKLSPTRRLFGFVDTKRDKAKEKTNADEDKFEKVLEKEKINAYAGRLHFNYAMHVEGTGTTLENTTLKILASPKPSAYENYLKQDDVDGMLRDYGDPANPGRAGEPRGRKFYYHNPSAAWDSSIYEGTERNSQNQTAETLLAPDPNRTDEGRFPCFRFTITFKNLEREELQHLLAALCLGNDMEDARRSILDGLNGTLEDMPVYNRLPVESVRMHKIGHGQPLGLGSALIIVDKLELLKIEENGGPAWEEKRPGEFSPTQLPADLEVMARFRPVPSNCKMDYPNMRAGVNTYPIHKVHTETHNANLNVRKGHNNTNPHTNKLRKATEAFERPIVTDGI